MDPVGEEVASTLRVGKHEAKGEEDVGGRANAVDVRAVDGACLAGFW